MNPLPYLIHYLTIYQLVILGVFFLVYHRDEIVARYFVFLVFCLGGVVIVRLPWVMETPWLSFVVGRPASAFTGALWLLTFTVFSDDRRIPSLAWWILGICVACRAFGSLFFRFNPDYPSFSLAFFVGYLIPQIIWLGFCLHAFYIVLVGYKIDLIEKRRIARLAFIVCIGSIMLLGVINGGSGLLARFLNVTPVNPIPEYWIFLGYFLVSAAFGLAVLRVRSDVFFTSKVAQQATEETVPVTQQSLKDQKLITAIRNAMEKERLYTKPGLTIAELAEHLREQEYRLRVVINQRLQYNNFSHFLNDYRIGDAVERLKNTDDPVSRIGLDVGYTSLSSFHKAFREQHGMTPREYRVALRVRPGPIEPLSHQGA